MKRLLAAALISVSLTVSATGQTKSRTSAAKTRMAITAVLDAQSAAWNRGDIDGYMEGYARLDTIVFVSGDSVTHGWQTVRDRYQEKLQLAGEDGNAYLFQS